MNACAAVEQGVVNAPATRWLTDARVASPIEMVCLTAKGA